MWSEAAIVNTTKHQLQLGGLTIFLKNSSKPLITEVPQDWNLTLLHVTRDLPEGSTIKGTV